MKKRKETRLVIIRKEDAKKVLECSNIIIEEDIQDNGKTIKLFIKEK